MPHHLIHVTLCRRHPLALAALLCLLGAARAQAAAEAPAATALAPVTVTATLTEQDARTAPASVTVITAQELAERNAADLLDAVRGAPGITFSARQVGGARRSRCAGWRASTRSHSSTGGASARATT